VPIHEGMKRSAQLRALEASQGTPNEPPPSMESLAAIRDEVRRERLLDMEGRLKKYRALAFGVLALALVAAVPTYGWWWLGLLGAALASFSIADHFMARSRRPDVWIAVAWGLSPVLIAAGVVATDGVNSPALAWFAAPAVTLGARFDRRGIALGTAWILFVMLAPIVASDPAAAFQDYPDRLVGAVALVLAVTILSLALADSDRVYRRRSTLDPLTGTFNRTALDQRLSELDGHPVQTNEGVSFAFLLADLDHFKRVNDLHGHPVGDMVLQDTAYIFRAGLRASDSVYRVGGEEFLAVLPGADEERAMEIAERLRRTVRDRRANGIGVTVSIGVAVAREGELDSDDMVARADEALYAAKAGGRDRVCLAGAGGGRPELSEPRPFLFPLAESQPHHREDQGRENGGPDQGGGGGRVHVAGVDGDRRDRHHQR
jgi:diguanylate cyclase (GGDEF)-like protein